MKTVKNVSRKVIGNANFRLLPGETLKVSENELWVQMYLADGKLQEVKTEEQATEAEPVANESTENTGEEPAAGAEYPAESVAPLDETEAKKTSRKKA